MKLQYIECSEWKEKLNSKPKLRTYKQFKSKKQIENYIKLNLSNKERSFLAQLRMGTFHSLLKRDDTQKFLLTKDSVSIVQIQLKMNFISVFHVLFITNFEAN